ncbi:MAG: M23 family metallopeptidase, partial [Clostridia bacterium]
NAGTILPDNGTNSSFDAAWPVPGFGTNWITSYWGDDRGHKGIDIAAYYGTPIVAAESGTVVDVRYSSGWGNHVVIYHNGTYTTLYAHMSSYAVSEGDYVSKNQVIGYVGSTGNSTGNHLHFEIYVDGTRVDPYPYL